jgi:hypothetical protein
VSRPLRSTPTPASRSFTATTSRSASERRDRYSMPPVSAVGTLPLATPDHDPGSSLSTLAFSRSAQEPQTRLTPPLRRTPPGQQPRASARLISKADPGPPISMPSTRVSTPQQRTPAQTSWAGTILERLPDPRLTRSRLAFFPGRSPRQSSANAAPGRLDARPRRADAGGPTILHLSHSTAYERCLPTRRPPSACVTHRSSRLWFCGAFASHLITHPRVWRLTPTAKRESDRGWTIEYGYRPHSIDQVNT